MSKTDPLDPRPGPYLTNDNIPLPARGHTLATRLARAALDETDEYAAIIFGLADEARAAGAWHDAESFQETLTTVQDWAAYQGVPLDLEP